MMSKHSNSSAKSNKSSSKTNKPANKTLAKSKGIDTNSKNSSRPNS